MDPPPGFVVRGLEDKVCFLKKSLNGLKQSPRAWFERFTRVVLKYGFHRCYADHILFVKKEEYEDGHTCVVCWCHNCYEK